MRIGINVPNELLERLEPYKHVVNISKICREAIKNWIDTFERAKDRVNEEDIKDVATRLQNEIKSYEVDWEAIGREDAIHGEITAITEGYFDWYKNSHTRLTRRGIEII